MAYRETSIKLDKTLAVLTKLGNFVTEFDCRVEFSCWEDDRDSWDWEVNEIEIAECPFYKGHSITKESDPVLWEALMRGIEADREYIYEQIVDRVAASL